MKKLFIIMLVLCFSCFPLMATEIDSIDKELINTIERMTDISQDLLFVNEMGPKEIVRDLYEVFLICNLLDNQFVPVEGEIVNYYEVLSIQPKTFAYLEFERLHRLCIVYNDPNNFMLQQSIKNSIENIKVIYGKQIDNTILTMLNKIEISKPNELQQNLLLTLIDNYFYYDFLVVKNFWFNIDSEMIETSSLNYLQGQVKHTILK